MLTCNLAVLAAERGFSLTKIAVETGISRTTLSNLVNHHWSGIQAETITALCVYLGVDIGDLLTVYPFDMRISKGRWSDGAHSRVEFVLSWTEYKHGRQDVFCFGTYSSGDNKQMTITIEEFDSDICGVLKNLPPIATRHVKTTFADAFDFYLFPEDKVDITICFAWENE